MKGGRVRGVEAEGAESEGENQWDGGGAESERVDAEGAELEGEYQRRPSRRGRCGGGRLLPPTPLSKGRIYRPSFREKRLFSQKLCL